MLLALGLLSGLVSLLSNVPYVLDTLRGKTKPHRVTWGIFFGLNLIFLANHLASGATHSLWLVVSFLVSTGVIFALSVRRGVGGSSKLDLIVLAGAVVGVVLWFLLNQPVISIIANVLVSSLALTPTFIKSYRQPESETAIK